MRIVRDLDAVAEKDRGSHAAIGNFDGVHRGHRVIIDRAREAAEHHSGPLSVVTFEPHPRSFFTPDLKPFRLTPPERKERLLRELGVEILFVFPFDAALAGMSAESFADDVLGERLGLATVAAGANFRFGHRRAGDTALLRAIGPVAGYHVVVESMAGEGGSGYSSSSIRAALAAGDPREAARQLGYWHRIDGRVGPGEGQGRLLGMRTANLSLGEACRPAFGVYAVRVDVDGGPWKGTYDGVANIGVSPMFPGRSACVEVHLFDFDGDLYGAFLSVALIGFQRREATFGSMDALAEQMQRDGEEARIALAQARRPWRE